ncbi:hypothetical protein LCGC14_2196690 [marine sediment metagenome]|uniref:Uncharacterized protein n=1 Tax=marine sediment metagenome TaxID=412755 RepID=A0A0F9E544_9ZZZZ
MTLVLRDTTEVKTHFFSQEVTLGPLHLRIEDFLDAVYYVLTNRDLEPNDPRLGFVKVVKEMEVVAGHNSSREPDSKKLDYKDGWSLKPPIWLEEAKEAIEAGEK